MENEEMSCENKAILVLYITACLFCCESRNMKTVYGFIKFHESKQDKPRF